jgi:XTP/dITP diphosphohydrolase
MHLKPGPLVIASHNPGKVQEILDLLGPYGFEIYSAAELGLPEPEETGSTFEANAVLKAGAAAEASGLPALADDSGLAVDALGGDPGIYSARWAGPDKDFAHAMRRIEERLGEANAKTPSERRAHFISVLALALPDGSVQAFEGRVDGTLVWPPRGDRGFGYDPIFLPDGHDRTFGEMSAEEKHGWRPGQGRRYRTGRGRSGSSRAIYWGKLDPDKHPRKRYRFRRLCALAVLRGQMPLLRLQQPRPPRAAGPGAFRVCVCPRAGTFRRADARANSHQHLSRRRHAVADGAGHRCDGSRHDREALARRRGGRGDAGGQSVQR